MGKGSFDVGSLAFSPLAGAGRVRVVTFAGETILDDIPLTCGDINVVGAVQRDGRYALESIFLESTVAAFIRTLVARDKLFLGKVGKRAGGKECGAFDITSRAECPA